MRPTAGGAVERHLQARQLDRLDLAGEGAADPLLGFVALDRGEEADGAEVDPEDGHAGAGEAAQRVQDRAVAAEHQAEVRARLVAGDDLDARGGARRAWRARRLCRPGASPPRGRPRTATATASVAAGGCEWVISAAVFTRPPPRRRDRGVEVGDRAGPRRRTRGRSRGCPSGRAARRRRSRAPAGRARRRPSATARIASRRSPASRTTPRPTRLRPSSNCGLTIASDLAAGRQAARHRRQDLGQGDEGDVDRRQRRREGQVGGQQLAPVEALDHGHPRILAQAQVDLAVGDVDRGHPRRARAAAGSR